MNDESKLLTPVECEALLQDLVKILDYNLYLSLFDEDHIDDVDEADSKKHDMMLVLEDYVKIQWHEDRYAICDELGIALTDLNLDDVEVE